jgi:hypothetical protein
MANVAVSLFAGICLSIGGILLLIVSRGFAIVLPPSPSKRIVIIGINVKAAVRNCMIAPFV